MAMVQRADLQVPALEAVVGAAAAAAAMVAEAAALVVVLARGVP